MRTRITCCICGRSSEQIGCTARFYRPHLASCPREPARSGVQDSPERSAAISHGSPHSSKHPYTFARQSPSAPFGSAPSCGISSSSSKSCASAAPPAKPSSIAPSPPSATVLPAWTSSPARRKLEVTICDFKLGWAAPRNALCIYRAGRGHALQCFEEQAGRQSWKNATTASSKSFSTPSVS